MMNKLYIFLLPMLLAFTACPGGESSETHATGDHSPSINEITEDSALEDADRILKEIDKL